MVEIIKKQMVDFYLKMKINEYLKNIFSTSYEKNVLLVYITSAFSNKVRFSHSNLWECKLAGEIFNELGYNVDVINYNTKKNIDISKYDIIYGLGETLEKLFIQKSENQLFINYATGCNPIWSNIQTIKKVRYFSEQSGIILPESSRLIHHTQHLQILLSDHVIVLGDDFVKNTYLLFDDKKERYSNLNAFYFHSHDVKAGSKVLDLARKNFLWFGSAGALHKGLDLCLDFFSKNLDLHLHICGLNMDSEKRFVEYYKKELLSLPNIHYHGFVGIDTQEFSKILENCGYVIFPSVSEGGAVALLNVIGNGGLLPIYSKSTGVPFDKLGFEFNEINISNISKSINKALEISNDEYLRRANGLQSVVIEEFSIDIYKTNLKKIISNIINDN
ncbi:glycosyltransferase [Empedobacter sp.]|uniref:glycosyltransferase n=1 Tax=Empedobacter sp. TaxID=1927715 RepID=UPI0028A627DD|nr:glycosyltransferase [Empedobacter sp.]